VEHFLAECKELGFHTAIETSSHVHWSAIERTIPYTDLYLCDLKHIDADIFRQQTGGDLSLVLTNLTRLAHQTSSAIIRIPLIPGFNDNDDAMYGMCRFIEQLHIDTVSLLPYHRLGRGKYAALDRPYAFETVSPQSKERIQRLAQIPAEIGLRVQIGS
jgi:pyruvate formate lyase activating enzyme